MRLEETDLSLRDEFLNGEIFYSMREIQVLAERWRIHYNTVRPHSSLGYRPPAPQAWRVQGGKGHGEVESKMRFPLPHTPDGGYLKSETVIGPGNFVPTEMLVFDQI